MQLINRWALRVVPPLIYLACAVILYAPFLAHPDQAVPGGPDGLLYAWYFSWTDFAFTHHHNPFISSWLNAPQGINVLWNTGVFSLTVLLWPVTHFFGPLTACGVAMTLSPVASASACYFALRWITGIGWPAAVISLVYGFGPFFTGQAGHLHLIFAPFPPLVLYFGYRFFVTQTGSAVRLGCWFGVLIGVQLMTGEELVVLTAVCALIASAALVVVHPRQLTMRRLRYALVGVGVGTGIAAISAAVPLWFQFFGHNALTGGVSAPEQRVGLAGLYTPSRLEYFSTPGSRLLNSTRQFANPVENTGYLGWPLIALTVLTCGWLVWRRDRFIWWWLATATLTIVLSLGSRVDIASGRRVVASHSLWSVLRKIPLLQGVIAVRFTLITTLLIALLLAWGVARLPRGRWTTLGTGLVVLAFLPLVPANSYREFQFTSTPRFLKTTAVDRIPARSVVLSLPVGDLPAAGALNMVWQMRAKMRYRLVGGWGVFSDHGAFSYAPTLPAFITLLNSVAATGTQATATDLAAGRRSVASSRIDYIVITNQQPHRAAVTNTVQQLTGCPLETILDVTVCHVPAR